MIRLFWILLDLGGELFSFALVWSNRCFGLLVQPIVFLKLAKYMVGYAILSADYALPIDDDVYESYEIVESLNAL